MSGSESEWSDDSESLLQERQPPVKSWDKFRIVPPPVDVGSAVKNIWWTRSEKMVKVISFIVASLVLFVSCVASKGATLLIIKQISLSPTNLAFCNSRSSGSQWIDDSMGSQFEVEFECGSGSSGPAPVGCQERRTIERVAWIWALGFAFIVPQVLVFGRSLRKFLFKFIRYPSFGHFSFVLIMEMLHTLGLAILTFLVLPELDSARALMLTASLAIVPSCLLLLSRLQENNQGKSKVSWLPLLLDLLALLAQLSGALLWPLVQLLAPSTSSQHLVEHPFPWAIPLGVILASCGWWESYAEEKSHTALGQFLWGVKERMTERGGNRYFTYLLIAPIKIGLFLGAMVVIPWYSGAIQQPSDLATHFYSSFNSHQFTVAEVVEETVQGDASFTDGLLSRTWYLLSDPGRHAMWILIIQVCGSLLGYVTAKFAAKVQIQTFSFSFPISLVTPACLALLLFMCGAKSSDACFFAGRFGPGGRLFFQCPAMGSLVSYSWESSTWIFIIWFLSYLWVTAHIWSPRSPRLASTEQIFSTPYYDGLFIDLSLMLNRRRDGTEVMTTQDLEDKEKEEDADFKADYDGFFAGMNGKSTVKATDHVTKIYACATMWHESKGEMMEMLKSLYRVDSDYSARRLSQKYLGVVDPDYYEWETHILFDNCMELDDRKDRTEEGQVANAFVRQLVDMMDDAGSNHYGRRIKVKPPKTFPTPYGGRLVWTLPGKTKIVCHLKDKDKIRHKKRWSQIMYMYYLLGYKLMELPISDERKEVMAENTYLLALDGDVDFQPDAAIRLIDMMKKNKGVGAACGRIHPTGSSYMAAYQLFEYAVGHWLQKATEHVLGCVLCSPGCFSMFRAKAIMDDNVMRRYTAVADCAREHVQFDQGEDRWLCTLLLQRGWRVEYSAASDSFTACPESFDEFYNQRRRWMPSTILNIWDLLQGWRNITKTNEDISWMYMAYQMGIMVGTFIGPGGIILAVAGACAKVMGGDPLLWIVGTVIPIMFYCLACYYTDSKFQLAIAKVMSLFYCMLMLVVYIGVAVDMTKNGFLTPTSFSSLSFFLPLLIAGMLHLQEAYCMLAMVVYLVTIPSMYVLLVIYSLFNMWNVSWGTREGVVKKTKAELDREKKDQEDALAEAAKAKKNSMLGTILGGLNLGDLAGGSGDKGETASVDFSFGNVLRCMCFTREDPLEPKKQLVKISSSLEEVTKRLSRIETSSGVRDMARRRSSMKSRMSIGSIPEKKGEEDEDVNEDGDGGGWDGDGDGDAGYVDPVEDMAKEPERDDERAPYWMEDDRLKIGTVDFLSGGEIVFWKEMISKYLKPLEMSPKEMRDQKRGLEEYRDVIIFTFMFTNALYIVGVTMLQMQTDIFLEWTIFESFDVAGQDGIFHNITYTPGTETLQAQLWVSRDIEELDFIGLTFLLSFSSITMCQMVGMFFHRWQTLCHYIASTKLEFFSRDKTSGGSKEEVTKAGVDITRVLQNPDMKTKEEEREEWLKGRRATVADLNKYHKDVKGGGETINLEREFTKKLVTLDLSDQADPMVRSLSTRRGTLHALHARRTSFAATAQRKKSVSFGAKPKTSVSNKSGSYMDTLRGHNEDADSDFAEEDFSEFSGSFQESGRNSAQFEYDFSNNNESRL